MTKNISHNKELRKMKRVDLLDIMVIQSKENEYLKIQLDEALAELEERKIQIKEAGSIAEAALQLNGVFEAAEKAGSQYLENIARLSEEKETINARIIEESERKVAELMAETQAKCEKLERDTKIKCEGMVLQAEKESQEYWDKVSEKLESFYKEPEEIKDIMSLIGEKGMKS